MHLFFQQEIFICPFFFFVLGVLRKHALSYFCYSGKFCFILFFLSSGIFSDIFSVELRYVCTFLSLSVFFICCAIIIRNFCIVSVRTRFFADISLAVQISLTLTHTTHYAGIGLGRHYF